MRLPEGLSTMMFTDKHTGELFVRVAATKEYINVIATNILDERIERAKVALRLCKHTKRKHRLIKLLSALEQARVAIDDSLPTRLEGSE